MNEPAAAILYGQGYGIRQDGWASYGVGAVPVARPRDMSYQIRRNAARVVMRGGIILIGLLLSTQGAVAGPKRDEVMSGAARCDGIADDRIWLDCFYGSAQPLRAALGLPPAPAAQTKLVPPPGASYSVSDANRYSRPQKSGGFLADILGSTKPIASDVPMESYKFARNRTFTVVLRNGQTYRQEESDLVFAKWSRPAGTYLVTITGASDKFVLKIKDEPGVTYRVRRM